MSERSSVSSPRACSGDMYATVPSAVRAIVKSPNLVGRLDESVGV
jgi:hypothetical protein